MEALTSDVTRNSNSQDWQNLLSTFGAFTDQRLLSSTKTSINFLSLSPSTHRNANGVIIKTIQNCVLQPRCDLGTKKGRILFQYACWSSCKYTNINTQTRICLKHPLTPKHSKLNVITLWCKVKSLIPFSYLESGSNWHYRSQTEQVVIKRGVGFPRVSVSERLGVCASQPECVALLEKSHMWSWEVIYLL